jgi:hypothetical protein
MSIHRTRTTSTLSLMVVAGAAVVATGAGPAAADPPGLNRDACATVLAAAGLWPGTAEVGGSTVRLYSDAYDLYLSRQAACVPVS